MPFPTVRFASSPNNHVHPHSDMESDDELKENIKRRIQEVFSSMLKSAHQKGLLFSDEHEAKFLEWLHAVVEETYRAELAREHQGQHKKDNYRTALLQEKQKLTDRIQRLDNIIPGLAAALPDGFVPSLSNCTGVSRSSDDRFPASIHKPNPTPNAIYNQPPSHNVQWQENERRRVREMSNFRAIGEAIRQIESNRQRQWSDWTHGRTTPPLPIIKEQEDILNRITRAAVSPPIRNSPSAPSLAIPNNKPGAPDGHQPHQDGVGARKYHSNREEWTHNASSTPAWPLTPPMESTKYSTSCQRCKPDKSRDERIASPGYTGYGHPVETPSYEIWYPPNMEEAGTTPAAGRSYMYSRPGNTEVKGKGKLSLR